jgi:hypothetical protein
LSQALLPAVMSDAIHTDGDTGIMTLYKSTSTCQEEARKPERFLAAFPLSQMV